MKIIIKKDRSPMVTQLKSIVPEDQIYNYIENNHHTPEDFIEGDIAERIEQYTHYKLTSIPIEDLDLNEFYIDETRVDDYKELHNKNSEFPPVVLNHNLEFIDGIHRANAANELKHTTIIAYVGIT
jgi:hypothetical protein